MTPAQLAQAVKCPLALATAWAPHLDAAMAARAITTPARQAAFLAQVGVESARLSKVRESTFYTRADRLLAIFPHDFADLADAARYVGKPEACASRVYANQNGNGDEASGDGWKYRGRGLIQITGRDNYAACSVGLFGRPDHLLDTPYILEQYPYAADSAAWYWHSHGCNELADAGDFRSITRRINGGLIAYNERLALLQSATTALA